MKTESARAFEAFKEYRDLGAKRSIVKVAQRLSKSDTIIKRWSDNHMSTAEINTEEKERIKAVKKLLKNSGKMQTIADIHFTKMDPEFLTNRDAILLYDKSVNIEMKLRGLERTQLDLNINQDDPFEKWKRILKRFDGKTK